MTEKVGALADFLVMDCCRGRPEACNLPSPAVSRPLNVLFLCTGNSARSILAEALLRKAGQGRFSAYSAGLSPRPSVNDRALALLRDAGYDTDGLHPKSLEAMRGETAPQMDLVVTVCDMTANVDAPPWPNAPVCTHWGMPDPAEPGLDAAETDARLLQCHAMLARRIEALVALPEGIDRHSLQEAVDAAATL